jgi:hypothetical protein
MPNPKTRAIESKNDFLKSGNLNIALPKVDHLVMIRTKDNQVDSRSSTSACNGVKMRDFNI